MVLESLIFDMDGVLVDVRDSYHATILETVRRFTGKEVPRSGIQEFKARGGYNNDWKLTTDWIHELGGEADYDEVVKVFQEIYRGRDFDGLIQRDRWVMDRQVLERLARRTRLAIFTGRPRTDALHLLERFGVISLVSRVVALEDVARGKPDPEGLLRILEGRPPASALFLGDTVDDVRAARSAGVPFAGVALPGEDRPRRVEALRGAGARTVLKAPEEVEPLILVRAAG